MLKLMLSTVFGTLLFTPQDFHDFPLDAFPSFTGEVSTNFRHADLDGDGRDDLVGPFGVLLQTADGFDAAQRIPFPALPPPLVIDLWGDTCYIIDGEGRLQIGGIKDGAWHWENSQPLGDYPSPQFATTSVSLTRMLFDLDEDGVPEIAFLSDAGLHRYRSKSEHYGTPETLDILPPRRAATGPEPVFYPKIARRISYPARQMNCLVTIEAGTVRVFDRGATAQDNAVHEVTTHTPEQTVHWRSAPMPQHLRPCRLNDSGNIAFAGQRWLPSARLPAPAGILESWVSLDGGESFDIRRTPALRDFRPQCFLIDFDGDGDADLLTEESEALQGGPREIAARFLTSRHLKHTLRIYPQVQGGFNDEPACEATFTLELDTPPIEYGEFFAMLRQGGALNPTGDFNGDGYKDLLLRQASGRAAIYLAEGYSFPKKPDATLELPNGAGLGIADVDADGRDDIILRWTDHARAASAFDTDGAVDEGLCRVYFSRERGP